MAASVSLVSTTAEGQVLEAIQRLQGIESDATKNPQGTNNVSYTLSGDGQNVNASITIPVEITTASDGSMKVVAKAYLT